MTSKFLDICEVERIDHGRDDLTVVNSARVSNGKRVHSLVCSDSPEPLQYERKQAKMGLDDGLISFLARHNHWTPFAHCRFGFAIETPDGFPWGNFIQWAGGEQNRAGFAWRAATLPGGEVGMAIWGSLYGWHCNPPPLQEGALEAIHDHLRVSAPISSNALHAANGAPAERTNVRERVLPIECDSVTFRIKAPIFIFRQLMRSNIGIVYNETSRRYVDEKPEYHIPDEWRARPKKGIKQGSGDALDEGMASRADERYSNHLDQSTMLYEDLLGLGVAPEQARMGLTQSMISELWMTATNSAIRRILHLRLPSENGHPQKEIVELATALSNELPPHFPRGSCEEGVSVAEPGA